MSAIIGIATLELRIDGANSLKDKRRVLKSLLTRLRQAGNFAAAEIADQDRWRAATIAVVTISNARAPVQRQLAGVERWLARNYPQVELIRSQLELL